MWNCSLCGWRVLPLVAFIASTGVAFAGEECVDTITAEDGYLIRAMTVEGWWPPKLDLPSGPYSPVKVTEAIHRVHAAYTDANAGDEYENVGAVSTLYIDSCVRIVDEATCTEALAAARCVDVAIRAHSVRFYLFQLGSNTIPVPRLPRPTWFPGVPAPLRALNPAFGVAYDSEYGPSENVSLSTDFLDLPSLIRGATPGPQRDRLRLDVSERKSFTESFYDVDGRLAYGRRRAGQLISDAGLDASISAACDPLGNFIYETWAATADGHVELRPRLAGRPVFHLGGQFRWSDNDVEGGGSNDSTEEPAGLIRAIGEFYAAGAFFRGAAWGDVAGPTGANGTYERAAAMLGVERDFAVATNQTIGVEFIAGAGKAWGGPPQYARFFGGNQNRNFLYDAANSPGMTQFPTGPLIRSFGEAQAGVRSGTAAIAGGTSYWNVNVNVSLPIPPLSRPLIPDEVVIEDPRTTLKQMLKNAVAGGKNTYVSTLKRQGVPAEEAKETADDTWSTITPIVQFIADQANLYAVKPLLLFDVAGIDASSSTSSGTRVAVGGGMQLTIVVAKLEVGYMNTVVREPGDESGNAFFRLVFEHLY